jgi:hypothetical protein
MTRLTMTVAGALALLFAAAPAEAGSPVAGDWQGDAGKPGYPVELSVKSNLRKGERGGTTNYPSFPCGGKLIFKRRDHARFYFSEKLTSGEENCVNGGTVRLEREGDDLHFRWKKGENGPDEGLLSPK